MATLNIDVMTEGGVKFYRTVRFPVSRLFRITPAILERYIYNRCPLLKYERDVVLLIDDSELERINGVLT